MDILKFVILSTAIAYTFYITVSFVINRSRKKMMKKRDEQLRDEGVSPYGSSLSHGMYVNRDGKIVSDQKESLIWYKRLLA